MRTGRDSWRWMIVCVAAALPLVLGSCCLLPACPVPGFVGVPEFLERSPDIALPLDTDGRDELIGFLARGDRKVPRGWVPADEDPGHLAEIGQRFAALLDALGQPVRDEDLRADGRLAALADVPGRVLTVHDARFDEDLDSDRASAIVRDGFVFALYWRRPVGTPTRDGTRWSFADPRIGLRTSVCAFRATYAIPEAKR